MAAIFIFTWLVLLAYAVRLIGRGWSAASEMDGRKVIKEETRYVTRSVHPEMEEVEVGDELLVVRFDQPKTETDPRFRLDSPALHGDTLNESLKKRIEELENGTDSGEG